MAKVGQYMTYSTRSLWSEDKINSSVRILEDRRIYIQVKVFTRNKVPSINKMKLILSKVRFLEQSNVSVIVFQFMRLCPLM